MFYYSSHISHVEYFDVRYGNILIVTGDNHVYLGESKIFEGMEYTGANFCSNHFYVFGDFGDTGQIYLGNLMTKSLYPIDFSLSIELISQKSAIISRNKHYNAVDGKFRRDYYYLDFIEQKESLLLRGVEGWFFYRFPQEDTALFRCLNTLKSLSLIGDKCFWELDLPVEVFDILGVYDNKLAILGKTKNTDTETYVIDALTGQIVWHSINDITTLSVNAKENTIVGFHSSDILRKNNIALTRGRNIFQEIDITTGYIRREGFLLDLDKLGFSVRNFTLDDDYIYFSAELNGSFGAVSVGVLDYKSLNLIWWQEVDMQPADGFGNFLLNRGPEFDGKKLYIRDKTLVLHIFEKEADFVSTSNQNGTLIPFSEYETLPYYRKPYNPEDYADLPF